MALSPSESRLEIEALLEEARGLRLERRPSEASRRRSRSWRWLAWVGAFLCIVSAVGVLVPLSATSKPSALERQLVRPVSSPFERWGHLIDLRPLLRQGHQTRLLFQAEQYGYYLLVQDGLTSAWLPDRVHQWWIDVCEDVL
jgi:hypothetical protein